MLCSDDMYFYEACVKRESDLITLLAVKILLIVFVNDRLDDGLKISRN